MGDLLPNTQTWMQGHEKIILICDFPVSGTDITPAWILTRLAEAADTFNTSCMENSLSRYPAFRIATPLFNMNTLLAESTAFLVGASSRPGLA